MSEPTTPPATEPSDEPDAGQDSQQPAPPPPFVRATPAADRTVLASADEVAAAIAASAASAAPAAPPADADPFAAAAPPAADPFAAPPADPFLSQPPPPPPAFVASGNGSADALVGVQLNELFEVVRFIAEGGMGRVYEGRNIASGEHVAIKVILSQYAADAQFMALFRREASALEKIGHDSLVKYRALAYDRGRNINYLVIEYVDGPSMAHVLTGDAADPALALRVLRRLALGLHAAHEAGVIHRDLSPDNVLLPSGNIERAKIIDFGIAKDNNPGQKSVVGEAFAGKFGYAAPEVFGKYGRKIGPPTDIYSLALVIAAFARGAPVDMGITIVDALDARAIVPDLSDIAPDLRAILERMLAPDPADRYQTMEEVAEAADPRGVSMFGPSSAAAAPASPAFVRAETTAPPSPPAKSRTPLFAGIGAVLLLAGVGGYFALSGSDGAPPPVDVAGALPEDTAGVPPAGAAPSASASTAPWASAAPQIAALLKALPCSDVRITGTPSAGQVTLAGWRSSATVMPASAAGWRLESSQVGAVSAPSAASCRLVDQLRRAANTPAEHGFSMPGSRQLPASSLPSDGSGNVIIDLQVRDQPPGRLLLASIDDRATSSDGLVVSGDLDDIGQSLNAIAYEPKPNRYLMVMIASPTRLPEVTAAGPPPSLAQTCASGGCTLTSGWIEVTR
ncbi:serine/threonine-protein kinase [Sandarakinorhabdus sp.]|uniref:serine/threonine-protein kinase n=1 Tax=Sandarakinorhabdus sp. TaxID=1916663 RepID=UPI00286D6CEE|nr:serine/threonine-protein kinase [Sandarakinorhabdus sp.]